MPTTSGTWGCRWGRGSVFPWPRSWGGRLRCVVFGKFGLQQSALMPAGLDAPQRFASDARRVTVPALFHMQWHDEVFPRDGQLALFDVLGSPDKQLVAFNGTHRQTEPAAVALWRDFVARHLTVGT